MLSIIVGCLLHGTPVPLFERVEPPHARRMGTLTHGDKEYRVTNYTDWYLDGKKIDGPGGLTEKAKLINIQADGPWVVELWFESEK